MDTSKAVELRALAEKFRRRANEMTLLNYIDLMKAAAKDLDAEAEALERGHCYIEPGRNLNITI